jgi:predicted MPP superfamily phosphohydrolase
MLSRIHFFPDLCLLLLGLGLQYRLIGWLRQHYPQRRIALRWATAASSVVLFLGYFLEFQRVARHLPVWASTWLGCAALVETMCLIGVVVGLETMRSSPMFEPSRRAFFRTAGAGLCVAPVAGTVFGALTRNQFQLSEVNVALPGLPKDLDGLRIVQITDIHLSPFLSEAEFARAIDMANETRAHLALVTGDLTTRPGDPIDACLRQLARLRADAGVLGCLGNHEDYANTKEYVTMQGRRIGIEFLRDEARVLRFGSASINFAGVDYQRMHSDYLPGAERLIVPGALNVMLSHNPDVFPVAAKQGYQLTIAGHTHGGQVNVELLHQNLNVARYYTKYVRGLYRETNSSVYVCSGIGTIGVPVRLGAPSEVSLLRLCAI